MIHVPTLAIPVRAYTKERKDGMNPRSRMLVMVPIVALIAGCATGYHRDGFVAFQGKGGYSEIRLNEAVFQVTFRANGFTRPDSGMCQ